jgi:hypothetical protein
MSLADSEILDRISDVDSKVVRLETKMDVLLESRTRCSDHSKRLQALEEYVATSKRMSAWIYGGMALAISAASVLINILM